MVADEGVSQTGYGAIWYTLERRYGIRFTPIAHRRSSAAISRRFTAILFPSRQLLVASRRTRVDRIKAWVRGGGTLVTMGGATEWAADENVALTLARVKVAEAEPKPRGCPPRRLQPRHGERRRAGEARRRSAAATPPTDWPRS